MCFHCSQDAVVERRHQKTTKSIVNIKYFIKKFYDVLSHSNVWLHYCNPVKYTFYNKLFIIILLWVRQINYAIKTGVTY